MTIKLIVGLRNPGASYEHTRHNVGGWFVDALIRSQNTGLKVEKALQSELATVNVNHQQCRVMMPLTFMNHSGLAVRAVTHFYRITPEEILVVHDDLDLLVGRVKLKTGGGHGGHNGLRDIINQLGSQQFHRLRIGIGHPGHKDMVLDYVLGKPSQVDRQGMLEAIDRCLLVLPTILPGNIAAGMNLLH